MTKAKQIPRQKRLLAIVCALHGCAASSLLASTAPTPPIVPTAPALPAYTAMLVNGTEIVGSSGDANPHSEFVPPVYGAGGYEPVPINDFSGPYSQTEAVLGANPPYYAVYGNFTASGFSSLPSTQPVGLTVSATVTAGSYPWLLGYGPYPNAQSGPGLFDWGSAGYNWLKVSSGGSLSTQGSTNLSGQDLSGTFVGTTLMLPTIQNSRTSPTAGGGGGFSSSAYTYLNFGGPATGYGIVNVDGGTWNDSNSLVYIGYGGQGFVTIQSNGQLNVTNEGLIIGEDSTGLPTAELLAANPTTGQLLGGATPYPLPHLAAGIGTIAIESGGTVTLTGSGGYIALGRSVSSSCATGNLYVTGAGTSVNVSQGILVGDGGTGLMNILAGASVTSGSSYAAGQAATYGLTSQAGSGTIIIDGQTSTWDITGKGDFGETGTANVTVQNSGNLDITGALTLGDQSTGNGTLLVQSQGTMESANATLANQAGAIGTATITGLNSSWTVDGDLTIGDYGTGSLFLNSSAALTTTGNATLGSQAASTGAATVSDSGTEWQINGELKVGDKGSASLSVENGGYVSLAGNLAIADTAINSTGTLTLDGNGSRMIASGTSVTIGGQGTGTMIVQNAADAIFSGASVSLGEKQGGSGTLTVQDNNTLMSVGSLTVGSGGTGIFNLLNSASLSTATSVTLGENATGIGTATIDNSSMTDANSLTVGGGGTGTLNIQNGGSLTVKGSSLSIGEQAGSSGTLSLSGSGSTLTYSGDITVGSYGSGVFAAQTGGQFTGTSMTLGENSSASGGLNITGAGSSVRLSQDLTVGKQGVGLLTITSGGILSTQGDVTLASKAGANATLSIDGNSSGLTAPNLNIGGTGSKAGGVASVKLTNAGHLNIAQKLTLWKGSSINTTLGTTTVGSTTGAAEGYLTINSTGELSGTGTITGNVTNSGGTLNIGGTQPGNLNITGSFTQSSGTLKVAIGGTGTGQASQLNATGKVSITGGTVEFDFVNHYAPQKGQTFQFIDPPQSVSINNVSYTFTGLAPGFDFSVSPDTNGLLFTALNNGVATPEPATLAIVALGGSLLLFKRRKRKSA